MTKKGKGRQAGAYGSKKIQMELQRHWQADALEEITHRKQAQLRRQKRQSKREASQSSRERPRFTRATPLRSLLRERDSYDQYQFMERRRANGFLPNQQFQTKWNGDVRATHARSRGGDSMILSALESDHPPGWLLYYAEITDEYEHLKHVGAIIKKSLDDSNRPSTSTSQSKQHSRSQSQSNSTMTFASECPPNYIYPLQDLAMYTLAKYLPEYLDAWGVDQLRSVMSLLCAKDLAKLSVLVSSTTQGMTNGLAIALGRHSHIQKICIRSGHSGDAAHDHHVTDAGLRELVPRAMRQRHKQRQSTRDEHTHTNVHAHDDSRDEDQKLPASSPASTSTNSSSLSVFDDNSSSSSSSVCDNWEDWVDDSDDDGDKNRDHKDTESLHRQQQQRFSDAAATSKLDSMELPTMDGISLELERLELLDCTDVTADVVIQLLSQCGAITHLSLAGSLSQDGPKVFLAIPQLLLHLKVLDVGCCSWMTASLLREFNVLCQQRSFEYAIPEVLTQGCILEPFAKESAVDAWGG